MPALLPVLRVVAVEADHRQVGRGRRDHRRHRRLEALRLVHHHVGRADVAQQVERALLLALLHPARAAELDRRLRRASARPARAGRRRSAGWRRTSAGTGRGSRPASRRRRAAAAPTANMSHTAFSASSRQVTRVHARLRRDLLGQHLADRLGQRLHGDGVVRHQPERLHVEDEVVGRALRPQRRVALRRQRVEGRVHLHQREVLGVEAQPLLGLPRVGRVERLRLQQRRIGPARRAVVDVADGLPSCTRSFSAQCAGTTASASSCLP